MARIPRFDEPGTFHHVMNRGARSEAVFPGEAAGHRFLLLLADLPPRFDVEVHGYALMPNHFHLLLRAGSQGLAGAMKHLQARYSRWLNQQAAWDGPVWRARYRSKLIADDGYLCRVLAYIHMNPVRARLVRHPNDSLWTSHRAYTGVERGPDWLERGVLLHYFGSAEAYMGHISDLHVGRLTDADVADPQTLWRPAAPPEPSAALPAPNRILGMPEAWAALHAVTGLTPAALGRSRRGPTGSPAWAVTLWWLPRATGTTGAAVARSLSVSPTTVSRAGARVRRLAEREATVRRWVDSLEQLRG